MEQLVYFYPEGHTAHAEPGHPERPERVEAVVKGLQAAGWWDPFPHLPAETPSQALLESVHRPDYLRQLQSASRQGERLDGDTYTTPATWDLALQAAGGALAVARAVWHGNAQRGFALCRPPGHHATPYRGMGFCLLNNIALAAQDLVATHGAQQLAIIDLDLHHGNGTQDIFWSRPDVFFLSTHQVPLYPGTGGIEEIGSGAGEGFTANLPMLPGSGDQAFRAALDGWILPLLDKIGPQMLLVSFGFDPHWRDPLGSLQLSGGVYRELVAGLVDWADAHCHGRMALILEGGYDLQAAEVCSQAAVSALLGQPWEDPLGPAPQPESEEWRPVLNAVREFWGLDMVNAVD